MRTCSPCGNGGGKTIAIRCNIDRSAIRDVRHIPDILRWIGRSSALWRGSARAPRGVRKTHEGTETGAEARLAGGASAAAAISADGARGPGAGVRARSAEVADSGADDRSGDGADGDGDRGHHSAEDVARGAGILHSPSLGHRAGADRGDGGDGADHAVPDARSGRALDRGDHPLLSRTSGRHRRAAVLSEAAGGDHDRGAGGKRGAGGSEYLRGRRDRIVAVGQTAADGTGRAGSADHADFGGFGDRKFGHRETPYLPCTCFGAWVLTPPRTSSAASRPVARAASSAH